MQLVNANGKVVASKRTSLGVQRRGESSGEEILDARMIRKERGLKY